MFKFNVSVVALACSLVSSTAASVVASRSVAGGNYAIQDVSSGLYVVSYQEEPNLVPLVSEVSEATIFQVGTLAEGEQYLLNIEENMFVTADAGGTEVLASTRSTASTYEEFNFDATSTGYAILALSNSKFVQTTADGLVNSESGIADAPSYAFVSQSAPNTQVAFLGGGVPYYIQDVASGLYVVVSGTSLVATASTTAEATELILTTTEGSEDQNGPATIYLAATSEYVTANADGEDVLAATAGTASTWEEYDFFGASGANEYTIKALSNGLYVQTTSAGLINSAYSQASGGVYKLVQGNPGRV